MLLLTAFLQATTVYASKTKDKSELYAKYPQLISEDTDPCIRGLNQLFINMRTETSQEVMAMTSFKQLNDLGSMKECTNGVIDDVATYSTLKLNITDIPVGFYQGMCLPAECSQEQLTNFGNNAAIKVNDLLIGVQKKFDLIDFSKDYGLFKDYSRLSVTLDQSLNTAKVWQEELKGGYIAACIFCTTVLVVFCIAPNVYLLTKHFKRNNGVHMTADSEYKPVQIDPLDQKDIDNFRTQ